jgi:hypothetical protein
MQPDDDQIQSEQGADVTSTSPLPDIPDAGNSAPIVPPEPVDISTRILSADAALAASTWNDPDTGTLYEETLDAAAERPDGQSAGTETRPGPRIYDAPGDK